MYKIGRSGLFSLGIGATLAAAISVISLIIYKRVYFFDGFAITGFLWVIVVLAVAFGIASLPLFILGRSAYQTYRQETKDSPIVGVESSGDGYIALTKHVLLCIFTCGIWYLIWIYRTTDYLNRTPEAETYNPTTTLLLCMFIPFYSIFWFYKHGQRLDRFSKASHIQGSDMATICLILGIFIPIVACILMQDRINQISKVENK